MFFISDAHAQAAGGALGGEMGSIVLMIAIFAVFWFLMIRPQQKREKERMKMLAELQKNDEVQTAGGICGKVVVLGEQYVQIQIAKVGRDDSPVTINMMRSAISAVLPKGTVKF